MPREKWHHRPGDQARGHHYVEEEQARQPAHQPVSHFFLDDSSVSSVNNSPAPSAAVAMPSSSSTCSWDAASWLQRFHGAKGRDNGWADLKRLREAVAKWNRVNFRREPMPRTFPVPWNEGRDVHAFLSGLASQNPHPQRRGALSFMVATTSEAVCHFNRVDGKACAALNYANGFHPGGGYKSGSKAQEEDLCRQFGTYFVSMDQEYRKQSGYPFGPGLTPDARDNGKYSDVLLTEDVVCHRAGESTGYRVLEPRERFRCAMIAAAAPNVKRREPFDVDGVKHGMLNIITCPQRVGTPALRYDVLVLGAWGCGAFGCDSQQMSTLFAQVIMQHKLWELYDEICFAVPNFPGAPGAQNHLIYEQVLRQVFAEKLEKRELAPDAAGA